MKMIHSRSLCNTRVLSIVASLLVCISTLDVAMAQTATPVPINPTINTITCPGAQPSRLSINRFATVAPGIFDNLRSAPGIKAQILEKVLGGTEIGILAGPSCVDNYAWWQINFNGTQGWVAEGDSKMYYLTPETSLISEYAIPKDARSIAISYGGISLVYNGTFGTKAEADTVYAVAADPNNPFNFPAPDHSNFQFYFSPDTALYEAGLSVFSVADLVAANADAKTTLDAIHVLVSKNQTDQTLPSDIPILPPVNAGQVFHSNVRALKTDGIVGVRFLTMFAQDVSPITNDRLRYVFEGFTPDGKDFVYAEFPVSASILPADFNGAPDFNTLLQSANSNPNAIPDYYAQQSAKLSAAPATVFKPTLENIDAIIGSIAAVPQS